MVILLALISFVSISAGEPAALRLENRDDRTVREDRGIGGAPLSSMAGPRKATLLPAGTLDDSLGWTEASSGLWQWVRGWILPPQLERIYMLRSFIGGHRYEVETAGLSPAACVDLIYLKGLALTEGDPVESLLICSVATLPYRVFDAVVPLFRWVVTVPVSTESEEQFKSRLGNLPVGIFADSPPRGDQDKLTHFFGSAYLLCLLKNGAAVESIGHLVEWGESVFKLEGSQDDRDLEADRRGIMFAQALLEGRRVLPSMFMNVSLRK